LPPPAVAGFADARSSWQVLLEAGGVVARCGARRHGGVRVRRRSRRRPDDDHDDSDHDPDHGYYDGYDDGYDYHYDERDGHHD
jgi:hypothetical protein